MALHSFHIEWDKEEQPEDLALVEVVLFPPSKQKWIALLQTAFPIALMQGESVENPDESTTLVFSLPMEEANRLKTAILNAYTLYSGFQTTN